LFQDSNSYNQSVKDRPAERSVVERPGADRPATDRPAADRHVADRHDQPEN